MNPKSAINSVSLGSPEWLGFVLIVGGAFLLFLVVATIRSTLPFRLKWSLFLLKATAFLLLAACLVDPQLVSSRAKQGENIVTILVDDSASMNIRTSSDDSQTRRETLQRELDSNNDWVAALEKDFKVQRFAFGDALSRVPEYQQLTASDNRSRLGASLHEILQRYAHQPLGAVLLFTDGNSTDSLPESLPTAEVPVYPVEFPMDPRLCDIAIQSISVSQSHFEDTPLSIQCQIAFTGKRPDSVAVKLTHHDVQEVDVETQRIVVPEEGPAHVQFQLNPNRTGPLVYRLSVTESDSESVVSTIPDAELTLENNKAWVSVNRDPHVSRILYVGGRPNWEHKFLGRALSEDEQLHLVSLVRIANKEAKFDFRGRVGESSNPLFRGFKSEADEETDDYSQPVVIRLNVSDEEELKGGFPKTKAELYRYDAVILDDLEAEFFTHHQQQMLEKFVSERGGGLLMLGGLQTFRNGHWEQTPVADALPVYLNRPAEVSSGPFRWELTRDGWIEPWMRLRDTEASERERSRESPTLKVLSPIPNAKPGGRILAVVSDSQGTTQPAVVVQQFGKGRTGAFLVGDLWRWSMQNQNANGNDGAKLWRQISRWLVGDVPQQVEFSTTSSNIETAGVERESVTLQVRVRDEEYQPDDQRTVEFSIQQPDKSRITISALPSLSEAGLFNAQFFPRQSGPYVAEATVTGKPGSTVHVKQSGWVSDPRADEFRSPEINSSMLKDLADSTGGEMVPIASLNAFAKRLPEKSMPVLEINRFPLWHQSWILLLVIALLGSEWGLRRWKGLA
ncbi:hypothetical protein SH668x_001851 [Planctomicrobium sp. SH668]|uniref:hypothetical protein n=1 Tax=Planctomicrobium sp. SH668 TaxID=3448126 RepID=UPI003F5CB149